jgi:ABC-2 type transport system permease protein
MIAKLCRQEGIKLFANRYPYLLLGIVLLGQGVYTLAKAMRPAETTLDVLTAPQLWADGLSVALRLGLFVILVIGAMGISQEFAQGTVKTVLILPVRRFEWVLAKLLALILLAWGLLVACALLGAALVWAMLGWGDVERSGVMLYSSAQVWAQLLAATGLTALLLLPLCSFALLVGAFFSSSGAAVGVALVVAIVLEFGLGLLDESAQFVFLHHLPVPFAQIAKMGKGLPFEWEPTLVWGLPVAGLSFAVFAAWLVARLERMDITE